MGGAITLGFSGGAERRPLEADVTRRAWHFDLSEDPVSTGMVHD
jgi:hypothetical protein